MRVRVTYSEDIERVPELVSGFLIDCARRLEAQASILEMISSETDELLKAEYIITVIDDIRKSLGVADEVLIDSASLLSGYYNALNPSQGDSPQPMGEPETLDMATLAEGE